MAKKPKDKGTTIDVALLTAIANQPGMLVTQESGLGLFKANLITVGEATASGEAPATITDAGKQYLANLNTSTNTGHKMFAVIQANVVLPPSQRGNHKGAGAPTVYPFADMQVGQTFFVGNSEKADAVKKLNSTVSSMNYKYSEPTGETKTVERTKRGPDKKAMLDANGKPVKETVTVDVRKATRKFVARAVKSGEKYGDWVAPEDGVLVGRTE